MAKFKTGLNTSRNADEMRSVEVEIDFTSNALASILIDKVRPLFLLLHKGSKAAGWFPRDSNKGWVHAEYSLLPGRLIPGFEENVVGQKGEPKIERLVARSLRAAVTQKNSGQLH